MASLWGSLTSGQAMGLGTQMIQDVMRQQQDKQNLAFEKQKFNLLSSLQKAEEKRNKILFQQKQEKMQAFDKWSNRVAETIKKIRKPDGTIDEQAITELTALQALNPMGQEVNLKSLMDLLQPEKEKPLVVPPESSVYEGGKFKQSPGKAKEDYYDKWLKFTNNEKSADLLRNTEPSAELIKIFTGENTEKIITQATNLLKAEHDAWKKEKGGFMGINQKPEPTFESALAKIIVQYYPPEPKPQPFPQPPAGPFKTQNNIQPNNPSGLSTFFTNPGLMWNLAKQAKPMGLQDLTGGMQTGLTAGTPFPFRFNNLSATVQPINPKSIPEHILRKAYESAKKDYPGLTYEQFKAGL